MLSNNPENEYRILTTDEIAESVSVFRRFYGIKQITLAKKTGVSERTVQRVERGERVDNETLRALAVGLGLESESFVAPRTMVSCEQAEGEVKEFLSKTERLTPSVIETWRDIDGIMDVHGFILDDTHVDEEAAEQTYIFRDLLTDYIDISDVLSGSDRVAAAKSVFESLQLVVNRGYIPRYAKCRTVDNFLVAAIVLVPSSESEIASKLIVIPNSFSNMMHGMGAPWGP